MMVRFDASVLLLMLAPSGAQCPSTVRHDYIVRGSCDRGRHVPRANIFLLLQLPGTSALEDGAVTGERHSYLQLCTHNHVSSQHS